MAWPYSQCPHCILSISPCAIAFCCNIRGRRGGERGGGNSPSPSIVMLQLSRKMYYCIHAAFSRAVGWRCHEVGWLQFESSRSMCHINNAQDLSLGPQDSGRTFLYDPRTEGGPFSRTQGQGEDLSLGPQDRGRTLLLDPRTWR